VEALANIPRSLTNPCSEFFTQEGILYQTSNGVTKQIDKLSGSFYDLLRHEALSDPRCKKGFEKLGITKEDDQVIQFYECNYSHFDGTSDLSECQTKLGPREYGPCIHRATCTAHGYLCQIPAGLTVRQASIAKRIALNQNDATICAELFISQDTLRSHKNNIEAKIGNKGKISIAGWAIKNKLL
jgi:DNA-binding CsgD family transcriptional regulator